MPEPIALKKIRDFIVAEPAKFSRLLKNKSVNETFGGLMEQDRMSRPPKGYGADLPHIEHIKNRHFLCETSMSLKKKVPKDLATKIASDFEAAKPLVLWLREAVK